MAEVMAVGMAWAGALVGDEVLEGGSLILGWGLDTACPGALPPMESRLMLGLCPTEEHHLRQCLTPE